MIRQNTFNQFLVFSVRKQFKLQLKIDVFNKKNTPFASFHYYPRNKWPKFASLRSLGALLLNRKSKWKKAESQGNIRTGKNA